MQSENSSGGNVASQIFPQTPNPSSTFSIKTTFKKWPITVACVIILWIFYLVEICLTLVANPKHIPQPIDPSVLLRMGANQPLLVRHGQVFRVFTATLLHANIAHIIMNTVGIVVTFPRVQQEWSPCKFILMLFVGSNQGKFRCDTGNFLHCAYSRLANQLNTLSVGFSTAISAILGILVCSLWLKVEIDPVARQANKYQAIFLAVWLLLTSLLPGIDFFGHMGSFISGCMMCCILLFQKKQHKIMARILLFTYTLTLVLITFL